MAKTIKKNDLIRVIKECVNEALRYDKETGRYFPDFTGDKHSDAGKYTSNNRNYLNYTRNNYQWANKKNQDRFEHLQIQNTDIDPYPSDPADPNRDYEAGAEEYLDKHNADRILEKAIEDLSGDFQNMLEMFAKKARKKYPLLNNDYYLRDLINNMQGVIDDFLY